MTIFISGSRVPGGINSLPNSVKKQLKIIMEKKYNVIIGDANGIDYLIQKYLSEHNYMRVSVYYSGSQPRNRANMQWKVYNFNDRGKRGKSLQELKDKKMSEKADIAYVVWTDTYINPRFGNKCVSSGTLSNVCRMISIKKKVVLYYIPNKKTYILSSYNDFNKNLCPIIDEIARRKFIKLSRQQVKLF